MYKKHFFWFFHMLNHYLLILGSKCSFFKILFFQLKTNYINWQKKNGFDKKKVTFLIF